MSEVKAVSAPLVLLTALQPAAQDVAQAIASDVITSGKWRKAAVNLYKCGLRWAMIGGKDQNKETVAVVKTFIESVLPEKKRRLLSIKGRDVVDLSDTDKMLRKEYKQNVGAYVSRIAGYLAKHEGIHVERKPRTTDTKSANADVFVAPETRDQMMVALVAINAKCNTLGLPAKAAAQVADAVLQALAILKSHKPADK